MDGNRNTRGMARYKIEGIRVDHWGHESDATIYVTAATPERAIARSWLEDARIVAEVPNDAGRGWLWGLLRRIVVRWRA
jgi:hypothetical protein